MFKNVRLKITGRRLVVLEKQSYEKDQKSKMKKVEIQNLNTITDPWYKISYFFHQPKYV